MGYRIVSGVISISKTRGEPIHGRSMPASLRAMVFEIDITPDTRFSNKANLVKGLS